MMKTIMEVFMRLFELDVYFGISLNKPLNKQKICQ